jgi:hypothetical protein
LGTTVFPKPLDQDVSGKQNKNDNSLETTSKTVVGAINEVNSKVKDFARVEALYENTTLSAIKTDLDSKYGNFWIAFINCNKMTDGSPAGYYIGLRNQNMSSAVRWIKMTSIGVADLDSLLTGKTVGGLGAITSANDRSLVGYVGAISDATCSGLPTSNAGKYYSLLCYGDVQFANEYSNSGAASVWTRYYANNQWYSWRRVDKPIVETGTITQSITPFFTPVCKKSGNVCEFYYEINGGYTANAETLVCTLPSGFRPNMRTLISVGVGTGGGSTAGYGYAEIGTDGKVKICANVVGFVGIHCTFIINP